MAWSNRIRNIYVLDGVIRLDDDDEFETMIASLTELKNVDETTLQNVLDAPAERKKILLEHVQLYTGDALKLTMMPEKKPVSSDDDRVIVPMLEDDING